MTDLKIIAWNCHSLYHKLSHFKIFLYKLKPHIVCLCETWLKDNFLPSFINYTPYFQLRPNRQGGGLAILVRSDIAAQEKKLTSFPTGQLEVQAVTVHGSHSQLDILSIYNPNLNILSSEFDHYLSQLGNNCIFLGDMNAKNPLWDTNSISNACGTQLADCLINFPNLCLLTPINLPTYFHIPTRKYSTLDLCFISDQLFPISDLNLMEDLGSDHLPTCINVNFNTQPAPLKVRSRWLVGQKGCWEKWVSHLPQINESSSIEEYYASFVGSINVANSGVFKLSNTEVKVKYSKPWWTEECAVAVKLRHHRKQIFKKHPTTYNLAVLREAEHKVKNITRHAKKSSFRDFCNTINSSTPIKTVWSNINKLSHKFKPYRNIPIIVNNNILTIPIDKANAIADVFEETSNINNNINSAPFLISTAWSLSDDTERDYNREFTMTELVACMNNLKNSSAGEDKIHNSMLKHLPNSHLDHFLNIVNISFNQSIVVEAWKESLILPILKPLKPETDPLSQRPISLISCPCKVMERLVNSRLSYFLESTSSFSSTQGGFRKRLCTIDQIARLEQQVRYSLQSRQTTIAIFIDFSRAFDCVWHLGLLYKLSRVGVSGRMLRWIKAYLSGRNFRVFFQGAYSSVRPISSGVPQGSILSPLLFNIMMSDIPRIGGVSLTEYADDICFFTTKSNVETAHSYMQKQMDELTKWANTWGMKVNITKTKGMIFRKSNNVSPLIKVNNASINFVESHKYLGMWLDAPSLSWKHHISKLSSMCIPRLNIMKSISSYHWGADRKLLLNIYVAYIRSILDYGCVFYAIAPHYCTSKLDKIQNQALRLALGAYSTSPIISLEVESNIPPLNIARKLSMLKYFKRTSELPSTLDIKKDLFLDNNNIMQAKWTSTYVPPLSVRCMMYLGRLNIMKPPSLNTSLINPCPPWFNLADVLIHDFPMPNPKLASPKQICFAFKSLQNASYMNYMEMFTDGSRYTEPVESSAAAIAVRVDDQLTTFNWKLKSSCSNFVAELFAIRQALSYAERNVTAAEGLVIYTDSLSSILALQNRENKNSISLTYVILSFILKLIERYPVKIQFIPAHKNIIGNEVVDMAAKAGHEKPVSLISPITREDEYKLYKREIWKVWEDGYNQDIMLHGKALDFYSCKSKPGHWSWASHKSRSVETSITRLRIGHVGLNSYLYRIKKSDTQTCDCGLDETVDHFLLACPIYRVPRQTLKSNILSIGVPLTKRNLLGGGSFTEEKQKLIINYLTSYLLSTGKLYQL